MCRAITTAIMMGLIMFRQSGASPEIGDGRQGQTHPNHMSLHRETGQMLRGHHNAPHSNHITFKLFVIAVRVYTLISNQPAFKFGPSHQQYDLRQVTELYKPVSLFAK